MASDDNLDEMDLNREPDTSLEDDTMEPDREDDLTAM